MVFLDLHRAERHLPDVRPQGPADHQPQSNSRTSIGKTAGNTAPVALAERVNATHTVRIRLIRFPNLIETASA
jgi:hypothetical protein